MINGILNVYKEAGFTSHDVVAKLRGIAGRKNRPYRYPWIRKRSGYFLFAWAAARSYVICLLIKARNMRLCFFWDR